MSLRKRKKRILRRIDLIDNLEPKKSVIARETAYEYAKERFENGALNTINYFQAQQLFETAQSELIKAKYDYIFKIKVLEFYFGIPDFSL